MCSVRAGVHSIGLPLCQLICDQDQVRENVLQLFGNAFVSVLLNHSWTTNTFLNLTLLTLQQLDHK